MNNQKLGLTNSAKLIIIIPLLWIKYPKTEVHQMLVLKIHLLGTIDNLSLIVIRKNNHNIILVLITNSLMRTVKLIKQNLKSRYLNNFQSKKRIISQKNLNLTSHRLLFENEKHKQHNYRQIRVVKMVPLAILFHKNIILQTLSPQINN